MNDYSQSELDNIIRYSDMVVSKATEMLPAHLLRVIHPDHLLEVILTNPTAESIDFRVIFHIAVPKKITGPLTGFSRFFSVCMASFGDRVILSACKQQQTAPRAHRHKLGFNAELRFHACGELRTKS